MTTTKRSRRGKLVYLVIDMDQQTGGSIRADDPVDARDRFLKYRCFRNATRIKVKPFCHKGETVIFES